MYNWLLNYIHWVAEAGRARGHCCIRFCMFLEPTEYPVTYLYVIENVYYFLVPRSVECQCLLFFSLSACKLAM